MEPVSTSTTVAPVAPTGAEPVAVATAAEPLAAPAVDQNRQSRRKQ
jgi:hypothetical protein